MLGQVLKWLTPILISCLAFPGCAHFTKSGRQQLAYEKYVRKQSGIRARQQAKVRKVHVRVPSALPSDPKVSAGAYDSPQSVTTAESPTNQ